MLNQRTRSRYRQTVWSAIFVLCFCIFGTLFLPGTALAQSSRVAEQDYNTRDFQYAATTPTINKVNVGFNGTYQNGAWVPVQVTLSNAGADFSGKLSITLPNTSYNVPNAISSSAAYQQNIDLPTGAQKQVTLNIPLNTNAMGGNSPINIDLLDINGRKVATRQVATQALSNNTTLVGILSDTPNNFDRLNLAMSDLFKSSGQTMNLSAATLPAQTELLQNFGVIVLDDFSSGTLSQKQMKALQGWVNQGGDLIVIGGPEWQNSLSPLPTSLLPVTLHGSSTLPAGTALLPVSAVTPAGHAPQLSLNTKIPITTAQPQAGSIVIQSSQDGKAPLIVKGNQGQGNVYFLAYDPTLEPLASWSQTNDLWKGLLLRTLGDRAITNASSTINAQTSQWNASSSMGDLLQIFFPNAYPSLWLILALLASYILILGPIRMLIVRRTRRRQYSWRIVLATILVFTLLSYGLALKQKGDSVINSSITVLQLNRPDTTGTNGHMTTYLGVFVPNQGDYTVHIPGNTFVNSDQGSNTNNTSYPQQGNGVQQTTITTGNNGTDVDLKGVEIWTNRTLIEQQDTHMTGGLTSHLQLQQNVVSGTVTNTLPYTIDDAYIAMDNYFISLGQFQANSTRTITLALTSKMSNNTTGAATIADQIAANHGMQTGQGYYPLNNNNPITDEAKQHALALEALSGDYCNGNGCYHQSVQVATVNGMVTRSFMVGQASSSRDPLLLNGAPITLFGWIKDPNALSALNQTGSDVTINGQVANGTHELLVQAPLDVSYQGAVSITPSLVNSEITHLQQDQSTNIQEPVQGTYTMTTGSMTFEYSVPGAPQVQNGELSFTANANNPGMPPSTVQNAGNSSDINHLQAYLYNWHTGNWDAVTFNQFALTVKKAQAYIGPGNRILLSLNNQDSSLGTVLFNRPDLTINGTFVH